MQHPIAIIRILSLLALLTGCKDTPPSPAANYQTTKTYSESAEAFTNPERGFTHLSAVSSEGQPLTMSYLNQQNQDHISLVWRLYYLGKFKNAPLSQAQLDLIQTDMDNLRTAGMKCILRFAYTDNSDDGTDAPIERVEEHLDQLQPVLAANADVIAFVNAGFVGLWGEWHSSSNDLASPENAKRIVAKLLEVLPKAIKIQLRTPAQKRTVFETGTALTDEMGYTQEDIARVGHHNDCFMASYDDYGTYTDPVTDKAYISQEGLYVPTGGETCPPSGVDPADCATALETMSLLRWTYLNLDWYKPIIDGWKAEGCFEDFEQAMGYRLSLKSLSLDTVTEPANEYPLNLTLTNTGWAPLYNYKNTSLVLVSTSSSAVYKLDLDSDIRQAKPGEDFVIDQTIDLSDVPEGTYALHLKIADQFESIADRPEYHVRLANDGAWDAATGLNDLQQEVEVRSE